MVRTEQELREASGLIAFYLMHTKGAAKETVNNLEGVIACLDWVLRDDSRNPVAGSLSDLRRWWASNYPGEPVPVPKM